MESPRYDPEPRHLTSRTAQQQYPVSQELLTASCEPAGWEVVYFVHPHCTGTCAHCWSAATFFGRRMPLKWHQRFWRLVSAERISEVRLTGGEPFENPDLGEIVDAVCAAVNPKKVCIFTSGRLVVSPEFGEQGVADTVMSLRQAGAVKPSVEIHMSADEHHAGTLYRQINSILRLPATHEEATQHNLLGIPMLLRMVNNFLNACEVLVQETEGAFGGGKLKVHVEQGRAEFHRMHMYGSFDDSWWNRYVIFSEGLIRSGRAREWPDTFGVEPRPVASLFIIPGGEFRRVPKYRLAQAYEDKDMGQRVFLDAARANGDGACILGFWNLVAKTYCGGSAIDALRLVGQPEAVDRWADLM